MSTFRRTTDKWQLGYLVGTTEAIIRILEASIDLNNSILALEALSSAQKELDAIRSILEESIGTDDRKSQSSE